MIDMETLLGCLRVLHEHEKETLKENVDCISDKKDLIIPDDAMIENQIEGTPKFDISQLCGENAFMIYITARFRDKEKNVSYKTIVSCLFSKNKFHLYFGGCECAGSVKTNSQRCQDLAIIIHSGDKNMCGHYEDMIALTEHDAIKRQLEEIIQVALKERNEKA